MRQVFFFPDNTVLINFTLLNRQDLVKWFTSQGTRQWTLSICRECMKSTGYKGLEAMARWGELFGNPLSPNRMELLTARQIADEMRIPGENAPGKHMGEAETIAIAESRCIGSIFLTDDHEAARVAESRGLHIVSTTRVIAFAEVGGMIFHDEARRGLADLLNRDRILGGSPEPARYDEYVRNLRIKHQSIVR